MKKLLSLVLSVVMLLTFMPKTALAKSKTKIDTVMVTGLALNEGDQLFEVRTVHLSTPDGEKYELVERVRSQWKENGRPIDEAAQYHCESGKTYSIVVNFVIKEEYKDSYCFSDDTKGIPIGVSKGNYSSSIDIHFNSDQDYINIRFDITVPGSRKYPQIDTVRIQGPDESKLIEGSTPPNARSGDIKAYYSNFEIQSDKWVDTANPSVDATKFIAGKTYRYTMVLKAFSDYVFKDNVPVEFYCSGLLNEENKTLSNDKKILTVTYTYKSQAATVIDTLFLDATNDCMFKIPIEGKKVPKNDSINFFADENEPFAEHTMLSGWTPQVKWCDKGDFRLTSDEKFVKGKEYSFSIQYDIKDEFKHLYQFSDNTTAIISGGRYNTVNYSVFMHSEDGGSMVVLDFTFVCQGKKEIDKADVEISEPVEGQKIKSLESDVFNIPLYCYGGIIWYENGEQINPYTPGTFEAGANYKVEVQLNIYTKMQDAVEFVSSLADNATINGKKATVKPLNGSNYNDGVLLCYNFGKLPYTVRDVSMNVAAPQEGNKISYSATSNGAGYAAKGTVGSDRPDYMQWLVSQNGTNYTKMSSQDKFEAGKHYKLEMDIVTSSNYSFAIDTSGVSVKPAVTATINGQNAKVIKAYEQDPSKYITLIMDFGVCNDSVIESIVIDGITEPIAGAYPEYSANTRGSGYHINTNKNSYYDDWQHNRKLYYIKNGVGWYDATKNNWVYENETFIGGHVYKPMIYLVTDSNDYQFYHSKDNDMLFTASINGAPATGNTTGSQGLVEQTISSEIYCEKQTVSYFEVYSLDSPRVGSTPDFSVLTAQPDLYVADNSYGVKNSGVNWFDESDNRLEPTDKFEAGKTYKVEIKVVPTNINESPVSTFVNPVTATLNGYSLNEAGDEVNANYKTLYIYHTYSPMNNENTHVHSYTILKHDGERHWYECSCGNKEGLIEPHSFTTYSSPCSVSSNTNGYYYQECKDCSYQKSKKTYYCPKTYTLAKTSYTFDNKAKCPAVTIRDSKGNTLKNGTDYTVSHSANKNVGTATAKVTFKGNYKGEKKLTFKINPQGTSISKVTTPAKKQLKISWKKQKNQTKGYEIWLATDSGFTKNVKKVTVSKNGSTSTTVKGLKKKTKYYIRIRTYSKVNKTYYYSPWSKTTTKKTKK